MNNLTGTVVSVHAGPKDIMGKERRTEIMATLEGILRDQHFGFTRWSKSKKSIVRNDRQWTGLSVEEVEIIRQHMNLRELAAEILGPNVVIQGIPDFSQLPRGTTLAFDSGALFVVEEFTDPCARMGAHIAKTYETDQDGQQIKGNMFPKVANTLRGLVGVIDRGGIIREGDSVKVIPYESKFGK